jgi:lysophospholipase L1-like esterase
MFFMSAVLAIGGVLLPSAQAQKSSAASAGEHWVTTWATAQQLMPTSMGGGGRGGARGGPAAAPGATAPNAAAQGRGGNAAPPNAAPPGMPAQPGAAQGGRGGRAMPLNAPATFNDQTVRMVVRSSLGGQRIRVEISNSASTQPVELGAVHVALHKGAGAIVEGTDRALTFSGKASLVMQPGVLIVSDPVDLKVAPLAELAISLYLPKDTGAPTRHQTALHTAYITKGDTTAAKEVAADATKMNNYVWISSVDVMAPANAFTVVALGDSITDGQGSTNDANRTWPARLAERFNANKATQHIAVVNQGWAGNQVLRDANGIAALARFDRDVLGHPGVKWVILFEGVNDINMQGGVNSANATFNAEEMIWGYKQIIERCHMHGIKVMGATVTPEEGVWIANENTEKIRQTVNQWVRTKGNFDAVADFDAAVRDPQHPVKVRADADSGDHIHLSDAGYKALADAVDLSVFGAPAARKAAPNAAKAAAVAH